MSEPLGACVPCILSMPNVVHLTLSRASFILALSHKEIDVTVWFL